LLPKALIRNFSPASITLAKRLILTLIAAALGVAALAYPRQARVVAQVVQAQFVTPSVPETAQLPATDEASALIRAAEAQVGVVTIYDPAYVKLTFPAGDVAPDRGVCTDVLIRAMRQAYGLDLQALVNADMKAHFAEYPANWGLKKTDRNIDHRRVPNLRKYLARMGAEVEGPYLPGDIVTSLLPGNLPHVMIVTDHAGQSEPMVVHNIGAGTRVEDRLTEFPINGHYRLTPAILTKMRQ
jgi:uncharacterized protein YijF (DUF1287 family)